MSSYDEGRSDERKKIAAWLRARARRIAAVLSPEADLAAMTLDAAALDLERERVVGTEWNE